MIAYDIKCGRGHIFEGWFATIDAFENQKREKLINCPICGSEEIEKIPSSFAIGGKTKKEKERIQSMAPIQMLQEIQNHIDKYYEDVGPRFTEEALKIHWGEKEERGIRGTSTAEEELHLKKEGVPFFKIPMIRYDS